MNAAPEALLWDVDGTLADSEPLHEASFHIACDSLGVALPADFHQRALGRSEAETHDWLARDHGLGLDFAAWSALRFSVYRDHAARVRPHEPAQALWRAAAALGLKQAAVSNSDRMILQINLARLGLENPGLVSVSRNDVRRGKPEPEPYLRAAHLLGAAPARCAVIEDSEAGAQAGAAAGCAVFLMPHFAGNAPEGAQPLDALAARLTAP